MRLQLFYRNIYRPRAGRIHHGFACWNRPDSADAGMERAFRPESARNLIGVETIAIGHGRPVVVFFEPVKL